LHSARRRLQSPEKLTQTDRPRRALIRPGTVRNPFRKSAATGHADGLASSSHTDRRQVGLILWPLRRFRRAVEPEDVAVHGL